MNSKAHSYIGGLTGVATVLSLSNKTEDLIIMAPLAYICGSIGGLAPDIDKSGSRISHRFPVISFLTESVFKHRGLLHTPFALVMLEGLFLFLFKTKIIPSGFALFFQLFILGYLSHLLLDFMTPQGIMLAYPLSKRRWHIFGLKSKFRDFIVSAFATLAFMALISLAFGGV